MRGRFRRISKSQKHPRETEREEVRSGGDSSRGTEGKEEREGEKWGQEKGNKTRRESYRVGRVLVQFLWLG